MINLDYLNHKINLSHPFYHIPIKQEWEFIAKACNDFINSEFGKSNYSLKFYFKDLLLLVEAGYSWVNPDLRKLSELIYVCQKNKEY